MGMYGDLHKEFARRTRENLRFIDAARERGEQVFEATQLVNSLLGMVVFLQQGGRLDAISKSVWQESVRFEVLVDEERSCSKPRQFIRKFRNAISHCNIQEYGEPLSIIGLEVWDKRSRGEIHWKVRINLTNIRNLADLLVKHVLEEL